MTTENWSFDYSTTGIFSQSEAVAYWKNLDDHMISFLVFPAVFVREGKFSLKIGACPPVINPLLAGEELFSTEHNKKSYVLKNTDAIFGSQNKLVAKIFNEEVKLEDLSTMQNEELKILCKSLEFKNLSSLPTASNKRKEILRLYDSIETGSSTCHTTGNEKGASGGWYSLNCRHGVIYAAKLLFRSESTRDAGIDAE